MSAGVAAGGDPEALAVAASWTLELAGRQLVTAARAGLTLTADSHVVAGLAALATGDLDVLRIAGRAADQLVAGLTLDATELASLADELGRTGLALVAADLAQLVVLAVRTPISATAIPPGSVEGTTTTVGTAVTASVLVGAGQVQRSGAVTSFTRPDGTTAFRVVVHGADLAGLGWAPPGPALGGPSGASSLIGTTEDLTWEVEDADDVLALLARAGLAAGGAGAPELLRSAAGHIPGAADLAPGLFGTLPPPTERGTGAIVSISGGLPGIASGTAQAEIGTVERADGTTADRLAFTASALVPIGLRTSIRRATGTMAEVGGVVVLGERADGRLRSVKVTASLEEHEGDGSVAARRAHDSGLRATAVVDLVVGRDITEADAERITGRRPLELARLRDLELTGPGTVTMRHDRIERSGGDVQHQGQLVGIGGSIDVSRSTPLP